MENKEITVYELMGLIKDNKAPKNIKHKNIYYSWIDNQYISYDIDEDYLLSRSDLLDILNDTVEILPEENDEWEDIEEINIENEGHGDFIRNEYGTICGLTKHSKVIAEKVNKIIKNQKYLKERLESKNVL